MQLACAITMNTSNGSMLSPCLLNAHRRSHSYGVAPSCAPEAELPSPAAMQDLLGHNQLLTLQARPVMETLCKQIAGSASMVLLSNPQGTILHALSDADFLARANQIALRPGITWSEQARGTNAIGTALAEDHALLVHASEHYLQANHVLTCACAPIHDAQGKIIGALDVSSDHRQPHTHTLALVRMSALMVENHLFLHSHEHSVCLHFHVSQEYVGTLCEGLAAFAPDGRFLAANRNGQQLLGLSQPKLTGHSLSSLFGLDMAELLDHLRRHGSDLLALQLHRGTRVLVRAQFDLPRCWPATSRPRPPTRPLLQSAPATPDKGFAPLLRNQESKLLQAVSRARKVLPHPDISLLIQGETGSGKEFFAQALHAESPCSAGPFIALNCAAIPETLIESELFGYEEGAFTSARRKGHTGKIVQAQGGTLFLDEIGDMPLPMQGRLLRVLQEHRVTPLGGSRDIPVDLRVISATHRYLPELIARGQFREDLYYRLNGLTLRLPALRERSDLALLIPQLLTERCLELGLPVIALEPKLRELLLSHPWPGNFRQLNNVLRSALLMSDGAARLELEHLPEDFWPAPSVPHGAAQPAAPAQQPASLQQNSSDLIHATLQRCDGNVSAAARALGISRNTVYRYTRVHPQPMQHGSRSARQ
jgi:transcriptional regulator of acetoin/glycerol metabolism